MMVTFKTLKKNSQDFFSNYLLPGVGLLNVFSSVQNMRNSRKL